MNRKSISAFVLLLTLPILSGCSSFHREWRAELKEPIPGDEISGPWEGHWISEVNGHNGRLRCIISQGPANELTARYHAKFFKIFSYGYSVPLRAVQTETNYTFSGEANLGKLAGGVYTYEGYATPDTFSSNYKSKHDHGRFEMTRPSPE